MSVIQDSLDRWRQVPRTRHWWREISTRACYEGVRWEWRCSSSDDENMPYISGVKSQGIL